MGDRRWQDAGELFAEALDQTKPDPASTDSEAPTRAQFGQGRTTHPESIGPYRLLERIAEGGMGVVYRAEQQEPVRRLVALKLVRPGLDSKEVVARFESERQALALMTHPNIAQVFDAGTAPDGRPFFVMEYVPGVPITEYCDSHRLSVKERLELFSKVCEGVQHAHHKGVIHRDLKPSNVLVMLEQGQPTPKIIDFGIAKAVAQPLTDKTLHTEFGRLMGTPAYMSPEQAELSGLDVDTRADVYSLGVLLYELLAGHPPFDMAQLETSGFDEVRRHIREVDPPRPSTRLTPHDERTALVARNRRVEPTSLRRTLRGDLDWITMRALEKNRTRRYGSPGELAADIERHLRNEPVLAGPPGTLYRLRKFTRRHRLAVTAATLVAFALLAGASLATVGLLRARAAEARALKEATAAQAVNQFLQDILRSSDPERGMGRHVTVAEALEAARDKIGEAFSDQPELEAEARHSLGTTYLHLADYEGAEELLRSSLEIRRRLYGDEHPEVAESTNELARLYQAQGDLERAEALFREALAINRELEGEESGGVAMNLNNLALLLYERGELDQAEELFRESLAIKRRIFGSVHEEVTPTLNNLGLLLSSQKDFDGAEAFFVEALQANRTLFGEDHPSVAKNLNNLAWLHVDRGEYRKAERVFEEALALKRRVEGPRHPSTATSLAGLASTVELQEDYERATELYAEALGIFEASLDPGHWRLGYTRTKYGQCLARLERYAEAEEELLSGLAILEQALPGDDGRIESARRWLAELYETTGREEEASRLRSSLQAESKSP